MPIIEWIQGDHDFNQEFKLRDRDNNPIDLTGYSEVRLHARVYGTNTLVINNTCTVTDAINGVVAYNVQSGDTSTVGKYEAEIQVTWTSGKVVTFPNIVIIIRPEIG